jgi:hypothetical protein
VRLEDGLRYTAGLDALGAIAGDLGADPGTVAALARMLLSLGFAVATDGT